ncbi:MAG: DUF481 domain-containing protein [Pseudomonadota bacterium]
MPRVLWVGGFVTLFGLACPAFAQEPPPPIIEEMLREALKSERKTVENILKRLYPDRIQEIDDLIDKIEDDEEARVSESKFIEGWTGEGALGANLTSGNVDQWGVNGSLTVERDGLVWDHTLALKVDVGELEGDRTDERISVSYTGKREITDDLYAFGTLRYERDRLQDISRRFTETVGLGYEFIDTDDIDLSLELGPALRQTKFVDEPDQNQFGVFARSQFNWEISDTLDFKQLLAATIDESNSTFVSETSLTASLYGRFSARFSTEIEIETDPPADVQKTDLFTRFSIVYDF